MEPSTVYPNFTDTIKTNHTGVDFGVEAMLIKMSVFACFIAFICLIGLVGNGVVFWILGFRIRRTRYTVYVQNLAVADFLFLLCNAIFLLYSTSRSLHPKPTVINESKFLLGLEIVRSFGFNAGMFLLTAISVERCLSVLYPICYRCHWLKCQSVIVCTSLFALSCLVTLLDSLICDTKAYMNQAPQCMSIRIFVVTLTFLVFIPLMIVSSLILVIVVQRATKQCHPPKLYIVIVVTVLVFIVSVVPAQLLWILFFFKILPSNIHTFMLFLVIAFFNSINSAANPFIYFFVGWQRQPGLQASVHGAMERVFQEDEETSGLKDETMVSNTS